MCILATILHVACLEGYGHSCMSSHLSEGLHEPLRHPQQMRPHYNLRLMLFGLLLLSNAVSSNKHKQNSRLDEAALLRMLFGSA